jgi:hypothetical protein
MNLKNAKSIIKVLLTIIDIKGELKMKDSVQWGFVSSGLAQSLGE